MKYFPQTISAAKEIEEERKQEEKAKLKAGYNDVEDAEEDADDVEDADADNPLCHPSFIQEKEEEFGEDRLGRVRTCLWDLLEYPETSKVVALVICLRVFRGWIWEAMGELILLETNKIMLLLFCSWKGR